MIVARLAVLAVLACLLAGALAGVAVAQSPATTTTTTTTQEPQAVEPEVGTVAPAQPGATTTVPEPIVPTTTVTTPATSGGAPAVVVTVGGTPASTSGDSGGIGWETIALITLGAILLFVLGVLVLWRVRGWDPRWLQRWRHAMAEAGWRLSLGWAEFRDFVRIGR